MGLLLASQRAYHDTATGGQPRRTQPQQAQDNHLEDGRLHRIIPTTIGVMAHRAINTTTIVLMIGMARAAAMPIHRYTRYLAMQGIPPNPSTYYQTPHAFGGIYLVCMCTLTYLRLNTDYMTVFLYDSAVASHTYRYGYEKTPNCVAIEGVVLVDRPSRGYVCWLASCLGQEPA